MESEVAGSSAGDIMSDVYNFNESEISADRNTPDFQNCITYEGSNQNMVFVPSSTPKKQNSLTYKDENVVEIKNLKHVKEMAGDEDEEDDADVYLPTAVYLHPLRLNGNYDNIIELIDVDPNEKLDLDSPDYVNCKTNEILENQHYDMAFGCLVPINSNAVPFLHNYTKICNNPSTANKSLSEDINLNHFGPKEVKKSVPPFLKRSRKPKSAIVQNKPEPREVDYDDEDDDVIFVKEWAPPIKLNNPNSKEVAFAETINVNNTNVEGTTSSSSSSIATVRRRRKRRTFGEKRKNPVRKAQIEKASIDLAEKLAIPPSVFNARVTGRKPKQKIIVETKNLRQSCRTTGAILSPPRTLTQYDYKEWPVDGMHERPFYDESTNTIIKYHIPNTTAVENEQHLKRPVLSELQDHINDSENFPKSHGSLPVKNNRKRSKSTTNKIKRSKKFTKTASDRLQMMLDYVQELKEFNRSAPAAGSSNQENQLGVRKPTLYEKSLEFHLYQYGIKENRLEKSLTSVKGAKKENIKEVQVMLHDACTLYSLASGVDNKNVSDLVNNYAVKGKS